MKTSKNSRNVFAAAATLLSVVCVGFAQGLVHSGPENPFDPKEPPPTSLANAYAAVVTRMGKATNQFHCISATCLERTGYRGWTFTFANTNGEMARVQYLFGAKTAYIPDAKSATLLNPTK
jgi:hypothetical protein